MLHQLAQVQFCNQDDITITILVANKTRHDWATTRGRPYDWCHLECKLEQGALSLFTYSS